MMHPKPQVLHLPQIFLVVTSAFVLHDYNQAGLSALLDLPQVVRYFTQVDTINIAGAEEVRNSTIKDSCLQLGALVGALFCPVIGLLDAERASSSRACSHWLVNPPTVEICICVTKKKKKRRDFSSLVKLRFLRDAQPYLVLGGYP